MTQQDSTSTTEETLLDLENELQQEIDEATEAEEIIEADIESGNISGAEEELVHLRGSLSRAQADYANLLKRVDRDRADMTAFITASVVKKMLPTVDNLERALTAVPEDIASHAWTDGIRATLQSLLKQLETLGVQPFISIDQAVDTERHEVMSQMSGPSDIIISEFEKGYTLHDRVIRHAKVIVGSGE
ncbi:MAG: nucleotide exchange factor GrpE [Candidatus Gracilibacteria bacterium]|nr:nucleotide exchange factor GrpE [Candidatus Gracilibacteria bacterium]